MTLSLNPRNWKALMNLFNTTEFYNVILSLINSHEIDLRDDSSVSHF